MNPSILILLALGTVAAIAVASSDGSSKPSGANLVEDARTMRLIFEFYSRKMSELSPEELDQLGTLNGEAKGVKYLPLLEWAQQGITSGEAAKFETSSAFWYNYRQTFFLPPDVDTTKGPDMFTVWAESPDGPTLECTIESPWGCQQGVYYDWFGRQIGTYQSDNTVHGESDLMVIGKGFGKQFRDIWKAAGGKFVKSIAEIASNYPGIGTAIAAATTFLEQVGSGASLENAALAAGRSAIPSTLRAAYDVGVGLATRQELDIEAALDVAMAAAISQGVVTGDVLERFKAMKQSYDDAKAAGEQIEGGIGTLGTVTDIATS